MKQMRGFLLFLFSFVLNAEGFVKGTLVKTPLGYSEIQDLQVGDKVISCDFLSLVTQTEYARQMTFIPMASLFMWMIKMNMGLAMM